MPEAIEPRITEKLRALCGEITVACELDDEIQGGRFSGLPIARH